VYSADGLYLEYVQPTTVIVTQPQIKKTTSEVKPQVEKKVVKEIFGVPIRLKIPSINVDVIVESVNLTPEGAMDTPHTAFHVGWFDLGPMPGEKGSAVIAGHVDEKNGEDGVFANLNKLKVGDTVYIENDKGMFLSFTVRESQLYNPGYADEVFGRDDATHLNLITCDGVWDGVKKSYTKRLVVFADLMK